jgi:FHA domain
VSTPERPKLVISFDEDEAAQPTTAPAAPAAAAPPALPTVAGIAPGQAPAAAGPPSAAPPALGGFSPGSVQGRSLIAATAGIVAGWAITEITGIAGETATTQAGLNFTAGLWVGVLGLFFAVIYTGWEQIEARDGEGLLLRLRQAGPWGAGLGFVAGFLANVIFHALLIEAIKSNSHALLYVARGLGWAIFGLGMGATTAAVVRAREKLINGALGGVVGGAAGGLLFEYIGEHVHSETMSRLIGLLVIGAGIGLAIGLVETLRREAWLRVVGGGMTGKEFVLYEVETPVGSSPKCGVTLIKDPAIAPFHFVIRADDGRGRRSITPYEGASVAINGTPVGHHVLRSGDTITVGATAIAYSERTI